MTQKRLMTKEGLAKLEKSLAKLEGQRPKAVQRVEAARQMGDLRENSEYHAAREDLALLEAQIDELAEILANSQIVAAKANGNSSIGLESQVVVAQNGNKLTYQLVGEHESDPLQGKISYASPLGQALMDKKVGDKVIAKTPAGEVEYKIISIK